MDHKERTDKENKAIDILAKKLRRTLLRQELIAIGNKQHKFDFASKDGSMVGEVKTSEPPESAGDRLLSHSSRPSLSGLC